MALGRFYDVYAFRLGRPEQRQVAVLFNDITERKRVENEQRFLADIGAVLTSTLDYEDTLRNIAQLAVRDLADFCVLDVGDEGGGTRRLNVLSRDPSKAWVCDLFMQVPLEAGHTSLVRAVVVNRQTVLYQPFPSESFTSDRYSEEVVAAIRAADPKSMIVAPLVAREKLLGVIALVSSSTSRLYGPPDVRLAEDLARRAASPSITRGCFLKLNAPSRPARTCWRLCRTISRILWRPSSLRSIYFAALSGLMRTR